MMMLLLMIMMMIITMMIMITMTVIMIMMMMVVVEVDANTILSKPYLLSHQSINQSIYIYISLPTYLFNSSILGYRVSHTY